MASVTLAESAKLEGEIKKNLAGLGYSLSSPLQPPWKT